MIDIAKDNLTVKMLSFYFFFKTRLCASCVQKTFVWTIFGQFLSKTRVQKKNRKLIKFPTFLFDINITGKINNSKWIIQL
jgi:hypothetical protein